MTIIYDMAAGSIQSDAQQESRSVKPQDKHPEILPETPMPALREFEPDTQPDPTGIHLARALLKQD
jgi:hypothetical protein